MRQQIRFCNSFDDVRLAYATSGGGPPLVKAANWLSHLELDWLSPIWRHWLVELSQHHTLIRYDQRGWGLSDWNVADCSLDALVQDLECVVETLNLTRFPLLGLAQGGAVAIAYAVKHPEKVSHLILYGSYARGRFRRSSESEREIGETMLKLTKLGWDEDNPVFRQVFTTLFIPDATAEHVHAMNELHRLSTSTHNAVKMREMFYEIDISDLAQQLDVPTLVMHVNRDGALPFDEGRRLAALIRDARFVMLEGKNHFLLDHEPAWQRFLEETRSFLGIEDKGEALPDTFDNLTDREREVLDLIAQGHDNNQIARQLFISSHTVRNHITSIFSKMAVTNRAQAIVQAREAGFGRGGTRTE
jgi:pimeloyl-ACP methyl ester carboxylesterase/DNA-binding CsgD family transcriptional regulator